MYAVLSTLFQNFWQKNSNSKRERVLYTVCNMSVSYCVHIGTNIHMKMNFKKFIVINLLKIYLISVQLNFRQELLS